MFQRLIIAALIVMGIIMLSRIIRQWLSGNLRRRDDGTEIRGQWEVVNPLGKLRANAFRSMRQTLEINTDDVLHRIGALYEVAYRKVKNISIDPTELRNLAAQATDTVRLGLFNEKDINPAGWMSYAVECVRDQHPDLYMYETRRRTMTAYHQVFPSGGRLTLLPDPQLAPVPNTPAPPGIDSNYIHLIDIGPAYMDDPVYQSLCDTPPEQLPDGAMLPLLHVLYTIEDQEKNQDIITIDTLLERYEDRLYPAVVEFLSYPERYESQRTTAYHPAVFKLISHWPQALAESLFRAAFESGWNKGAQFLPNEGWAKDLIAAFADSPYGPPK
jgi:hypothetical protein